jgi:hypothetical protein
MTLRTPLKWLLALALGLPLLQSLLFWIANLLAAMGDEAGAAFLSRANIVFGVLWLATLIGLVVLLACRALDDETHVDE